MSENTQSTLIGRSLAHNAKRCARAAIFAFRFEKEKPAINPFSREKHPSAISEPARALAAALKQRGLDSDAEFMGVLGDAVLELSRVPMQHLLNNLQYAEQYGSGGPDPEFVLKFPSGDLVDMADVLKGFIPESDELGVGDEVCLQIDAEWPRNSCGQGACPCCGYFTLVDPPGSYETCPVCSWREDCDLSDPWNAECWGAVEIDEDDPIFKEVPGFAEDMKSREILIGQARQNFERVGKYSLNADVRSRKPRPEEMPRYEWSQDSRPRFTC